MSDDPREELARITASLRRTLRRESAAGLGDLLAVSAARRRGVGTGPPPDADVAVAGARAIEAVAVAEPVAPSRADARRTSIAEPPRVADAPNERSMFDEATEGPLPGSALRSSSEFRAALPPAGLAARAAIARAAEPLLAAIAEEVKVCEKCALAKLRNRAVPGIGSAKSGIVFVGEGPGAEEDRLGEPFVGRGGQLLDKIIQAMDDAKLIPDVPLNRETIFIGNIVHCRPPENRVPLPNEVEMSSPYLLRQLDAIQPRIICCLGKTAAEMLLGDKGPLGGMRGKVHRFRGAKLIVTYHPAACLRNPAYKRPVWEDMQLLAREYLKD